MARFESGGTLCPQLATKVDHSRRVAAEAREIADELGWPDGDALTAGALGLLHDVGRFSQLAEHGTFNDGRSVNHGERGYEVLLSEEPLDLCSGEDRAVIFDGVRYHNAESLAHLGGESLRFARLVRDADKLDIYGVVHRALSGAPPGEDGGLMWDVDMHGPPSDDVLDHLRRGQPVPTAALRSLADCLLWQVGWVFDINYVPAMRRLRERRLLEREREFMPPGPAIDAAVEVAIRFRDAMLTQRAMP